MEPPIQPQCYKSEPSETFSYCTARHFYVEVRSVRSESFVSLDAAPIARGKEW